MRGNGSVLRVDEVNFAYGRTQVLKGISLSVEPGQSLCLLGPSGCGKTTLLYMIAGLLNPTSGRIYINEQDQQYIPTYRRNIGFVFQDIALFPHLNVYENVAFPFTHCHKRIKQDWRKEVARILDITGIKAQSNNSIANLSGGQRQRVALARALVYQPSLLLLDEPLSSLDNLLKRQLLDLLNTLHEEYDTTFIYVTHDESEVLRIATHVAILDESHKLKQIGPVQEVINQPQSKEVAQIIGEWNLFKIKNFGEPPKTHFENGIEIDLGIDPRIYPQRFEIGVPVKAVELSGTSPNPTSEIVLEVLVKRRFPSYERILYEMEIIGDGNQPSRIYCYGDLNSNLKVEKKTKIKFRKEAIHVFPQN